MVGLAKVTVDGLDAGAVSWDQKRRIANFEYFSSYIARGRDISPIKMPLSRSANRVYSFKDLQGGIFQGLPGLLSDSLPAGYAQKVLHLWLQTHEIGHHDLSPLDLLRIIGSSGPGLLDYEPSGRIAFPDPEPLDWEKLQCAAGHLASGNSDRHNILVKEKQFDQFAAAIINCGRPDLAAAIAVDSESGDIYAGHRQSARPRTDWTLMLNPATADRTDASLKDGRVTYATYLMALDCGIDAAECRLLDTGNTPCAMFRRTDRTVGESSGQGKVHTQSLSALTHVPPDNPETATYETAFQVMRLLKMPHAEAIQLYKRLVFHLLTGSTGPSPTTLHFHMDHDGRWRLAPAVLSDNSGALNRDDQDARGRSRPLTMRVAGKREAVTRENLLSLARSISLKSGEEILRDMTDTVSHWTLYSEEAGLQGSLVSSMDQFFRQASQSLIG